MRVKCLAREHNTMSPAKARTLAACSGTERTNHEATAPPTCLSKICYKMSRSNCLTVTFLTGTFKTETGTCSLEPVVLLKVDAKSIASRYYA